ncbi:E3 binding domain-containing protein, partial [Streptosporangium carneum]|uniref:E3 binding domain-containing protein n=1 Tax=Streptosporangium carneum TaxID=47481 RepID=UPI0022F2FC7F
MFDEGSHSGAEIDAFVADFKPAEGGIAQGAGKGGAEKTKTQESAPAAAAAPAPEKQRIKIDTNRPISPEALRLAEEEGVDIAGIEGSGRGGRITHQDVVKALRGEGA